MTKPRIFKRAGWWYCCCKKGWANSRNSWQEAYQLWWEMVKVY